MPQSLVVRYDGASPKPSLEAWTIAAPAQGKSSTLEPRRARTHTRNAPSTRRMCVPPTGPGASWGNQYVPESSPRRGPHEAPSVMSAPPAALGRSPRSRRPLVAANPRGDSRVFVGAGTASSRDADDDAGADGPLRVAAGSIVQATMSAVALASDAHEFASSERSPITPSTSVARCTVQCSAATWVTSARATTRWIGVAPKLLCTSRNTASDVGHELGAFHVSSTRESDSVARPGAATESMATTAKTNVQCMRHGTIALRR